MEPDNPNHSRDSAAGQDQTAPQNTKRKSDVPEPAGRRTQKIIPGQRKQSTANGPARSNTVNNPVLPNSQKSTGSEPRLKDKLLEDLEASEGTDGMLLELESRQLGSKEQRAALDISEIPPQYQEGTIVYEDAVRRNTMSIQSTPPSHTAAGRIDERHVISTHESQGLLGKVTSRLFGSSPKALSKNEQHKERTSTHLPASQADHPPDEGHSTRGKSSPLQNKVIDRRQRYQDSLEAKEREWKDRERDLMAQLHQSETETRRAQDEYLVFIRKQQEASFSRMESARWLPKDEGKVIGDLDRLKKSMRNWAKLTSVKDMSFLQSLDRNDSAALMQSLARGVLLENGQLPQGLLTAPKSPMLLLNALLAYSVYTSFFRNPFFCFTKETGDSSLTSVPKEHWESIYRQAQKVRNDTSEGEKFMRRNTEALISRAAEQQSSVFLAGPARHFINSETQIDFASKLHSIFQEAATNTYMLWTRRTHMRCVTLGDLRDRRFDAESPCFEPDTLVRYDEHEGHLKGPPITVMVHPLLEVYGTDEGQDYDSGRVWTKGGVWLDSRMG
ncbi:hypothetical protein LSUE1_G004631 [Lachnellula suecica]|uniref:Uncharacterized protein n=1 Tax=Lachnellula suecica TaxID=602035 RepID=A0A8T9CC68_9HELO|nr:hypothetical protein LSUE1_G004631 [Lachnellula suecica]